MVVQGPDGTIFKVCTACEAALPLGTFPKNRRGTLGLNSVCNPCKKARAAEYKAANLEAVRARAAANARRRYAKDPESQRLATKRWREANPEKRKQAFRSWYMQKQYGLDEVGYQAMLLAQGSACAICRSAEPRGKGTFHVDHDHRTGRVRKLLCHRCNTVLGTLDDDPALIEAMLAYVKEHAGEETALCPEPVASGSTELEPSSGPCSSSRP